MKTSESLSNIAAALSKAQGSIQPALKDATNPHLKSKYADLGSVWEACRDALRENGLSVIQLPSSDEPGYIALETMLLHTSGEYISERMRMPLVKNDPQGAGSALTYARRYALSAALGITAEDDDGHAASQPARREPRTREQAQEARTAPAGISTDAANRLHAALGAILASTQYAQQPHHQFAGSVVGREIQSLTELTTPEAKSVHAAAKVAEQEAA